VYAKGYLSVWLTIPLMALPISLLHEMEHDLIHNLYAKKWPFMQDVMFFGIWLAKLHGSPWFRRQLHLHHHKLSGQANDAEERLIGLGIPYGVKRMAITVHPIGGILVAGDSTHTSSRPRPSPLARLPLLPHTHMCSREGREIPGRAEDEHHFHAGHSDLGGADQSLPGL
jgi:hypothetical protein